jgi:hypothetical protein
MPDLLVLVVVRSAIWRPVLAKVRWFKPARSAADGLDRWSQQNFYRKDVDPFVPVIRLSGTVCFPEGPNMVAIPLPVRLHL